MSLCSLGYCSVGIDEGWENCTDDGSYVRDAKGRPIPDLDRFPDLRALVEYGHTRGVKMGWYLNGCKCKPPIATDLTYAGDIDALHAFGFDGVKLDDCGPHRNFTLYAELMRNSGRNYTIEVHNPSAGACADTSTCPTSSWCPFNWFRTSHDINTKPQSWVTNLQTTTRFQDAKAPLSQPSCWAYPDMLEVGRVEAPGDASTWFSWNRAHFGAWCVTSSPLILGLELSDARLAPILPIIGNKDAIRVNQQWAGHPGGLAPAAVLNVTAEGVQLWAKAQPGGAVAAFVLNGSPLPLTAAYIDFAALGAARHSTARDIWTRKSLGAFERGITLHVPAWDSAFILLSPQAPIED